VVPARRAFCIACEALIPEPDRKAAADEVFAARARERTEAGVPFLVRMDLSGWGWAIEGPAGSTAGWGSYQTERAAADAEWVLTRAYELGQKAGPGRADVECVWPDCRAQIRWDRIWCEEHEEQVPEKQRTELTEILRRTRRV
jgi:hypothetical protein